MTNSEETCSHKFIFGEDVIMDKTTMSPFLVPRDALSAQRSTATHYTNDHAWSVCLSVTLRSLL